MYYGATDIENGRFVLLLEDLADARLGDALNNCSSQEAELVVHEMARFHSTWWEHPRLAGLEWLPGWGGNPEAAQNRLGQREGPFLEKFGHKLPESMRQIIHKLRSKYGGVLAELGKSPWTMIHGDLHLDNVLFNLPVTNSPITILDWQSVARGRSAIDFALFIFGSLEIEQRRTVENDLMRAYHSGLIGGGVQRYEFDQFLPRLPTGAAMAVGRYGQRLWGDGHRFTGRKGTRPS